MKAWGQSGFHRSACAIRSLQWMGGNDIEGILFEKFSVIVKRKDGKEEELELCEGGKTR